MRLAIALLLLLIVPAMAQDATAPDVVVREGLDPASGAVVGQHVTLHVDVLFASTMPRPPRVSVPDVPGLQVIRFETQGTTMRESIGGKPYVGQRFDFALYARRGGAFDIPPATVTLLDSAGGETGHAAGQPLRLDIGVPPGIDASKPVVATRRLTLDQQWQPMPIGPFKPGDAVVRTITRSAEDVPGLAMLDLDLAAPEGVRAYADPPDIRDSVGRGVVTGRRVDRVTYVFEHGGDFRLPAVAQPWWDLGTHALKTAGVAETSVHVDPAAVATTGTSRSWNVRGLAGAALAVAGLIVLAFLGRTLLRHLRARRAEPERVAFAALRHACRAGEVSELYRRFAVWAALLPPAQRRAADEEATPLRAALFGGHAAPWSKIDASELLARLDALRRQRRAGRPISVLPPLNPALPGSSWADG
ncbi:BatD family protein [Ancylobacter sp. 6x-1]|uniref:BatD family protein n=1 Tax=Ancylobacter crimeensis TaxID=2579147 RepID=A0ABT0DF17_9HYPH|nr:BatD family protein [Ancylobacter crimeensis]MCK0198550.1 BatD family protein [Ancylobacter crimeensis]